MASHIGHVVEFVEGREEWSQYAERLGHFMSVNGITEAERKRDVFLSVMEPKEYRLLGSLIVPTKPGEKSYAQLVRVLANHHNAAPSEIVHCYRFHTQGRGPGETVATYVTKLHSLAQACNFGNSLDDMIRDHLVCGVNDDTIQHRLLAQPKLDYKKALEITNRIETSSKNL